VRGILGYKLMGLKGKEMYVSEIKGETLGDMMANRPD
jgi:hypothetical protein